MSNIIVTIALCALGCIGVMMATCALCCALFAINPPEHGTYDPEPREKGGEK